MGDTSLTEPIDVTDYPENLSHKGKTTNVYDKTLCEDNKPLIDFINKCILLDPTIEMERIINKVLLPAYCNADSEYKKSDKFKKVITKAFRRLVNNPEKKYNHICGVFETLKVHEKTLKKKKRAELVPLSTTVSTDRDWRKRAIDNKNNHNKMCPKKRKLDVIDLDCNDDFGEIMAVDNPELVTMDDRVETENYLVNGNSTKIQDAHELKLKETQANDKANVNNFTANAPGVATVNRSEINSNAPLHNKSPHKKKRVSLLTLSTTVSGKTNTDFRTKDNGNTNNDKVSRKNPQHDVIKLDSDEDSNNSEMTDDEVISSVKIYDTQKFKMEEKMQASAKTDINNLVLDTPVAATVDCPLADNIIEIQDSQELKLAEDIQNDNILITKTSYTNRVVNEIEEDKENFEDIDNSIDSANKLLIPQLVHVETIQIELDEAEKARKIKQIEATIAKCKKKISELELAEVDNDTDISPYIQCHRLETRIVRLYNELCELGEAEPAKGREVRLRVSEGNPEGPIRRLEAFLNEQVDAEGVAPFPDFIDVVRCVKKANKEDGLGWSKPQIMNEAKEIFIYCGRALQKRRQQREYKHMRSRIPREAFEDDPAERDAELMAKLELNKKLARKKEKEMLKKHCRMQKDLTKMNVQSEDKTRVSSCFFTSHENETGSSDDEQTPGPSNKSMGSPTEENFIIEQNSPNNSGSHETCLDSIIVTVKEEPMEMPLKIQYKGDISLVIEISDSESSDDEIEPSSVQL